MNLSCKFVGAPHRLRHVSVSGLVEGDRIASRHAGGVEKVHRKGWADHVALRVDQLTLPRTQREDLATHARIRRRT
jgi:hypothetical protein